MDIYLKACAGVLLAVVLVLVTGSKAKELGLLLTVAVCVMVCACAMQYLSPVLDFIEQLTVAGGLDHAVIKILLKVVGIGVISEITSLVCTDSGNSSMGKALQLLGTGVILWLSIPVFSMVLELIQTMLGDI